MPSIIDAELTTADHAEAAVVGIKTRTLPDIAAAELLRIAGRVAAENSIHFSSAGPLNGARRDVCLAFSGLVKAIEENGPRDGHIQRASTAIDAWKRELSAMRPA